MGHRHCFPIYTYKRGDMDKNDLQKKKNHENNPIVHFCGKGQINSDIVTQKT